jgi:hypothetical protein
MSMQQPDLSPGSDLSPRPDAVGLETHEPKTNSGRRPLRLSHRLSFDASSPLLQALPIPPNFPDAQNANTSLSIDAASMASGSDSARSVDSLRSLSSLRSDSVAAIGVISPGTHCAHTFDMSRVISAVSIPEFRFEDDRWIFVRVCTCKSAHVCECHGVINILLAWFPC